MMQALEQVAALDPNDLKTLLADVENMSREKWDWALPESLLMKSFASTSLDIEAATGFAKAQTQLPGASEARADQYLAAKS